MGAHEQTGRIYPFKHEPLTGFHPKSSSIPAVSGWISEAEHMANDIDTGLESIHIPIPALEDLLVQQESLTPSVK